MHHDRDAALYPKAIGCRLWRSDGIPEGAPRYHNIPGSSAIECSPRSLLRLHPIFASSPLWLGPYRGGSQAALLRNLSAELVCNRWSGGLPGLNQTIWLQEDGPIAQRVDGSELNSHHLRSANGRQYTRGDASWSKKQDMEENEDGRGGGYLHDAGEQIRALFSLERGRAHQDHVPQYPKGPQIGGPAIRRPATVISTPQNLGCNVVWSSAAPESEEGEEGQGQ